MKIWLLKSLNNLLFIVIGTILFLNTRSYSLGINAKTHLYKTDLNKNILGSNTSDKNLITEDLNKEVNFDFSFQKSSIKKNKSTVSELIQINYEKNKKNANIITTNNPENNLSTKPNIVTPIAVSIESNNNNNTNKKDVKNNPNNKNENSQNKNEINNQVEKPSFFSALFDKSKSLNIKGGFFNEFATSFSLNFFSEIGDKSFIAVFLFTNQASWVTLFLVASITEVLFNLLSVVIGYNLRAYESIYFVLIYITIFTTLLFGFLLLKEAIFEEEEEEEKQQVEAVNVDCEKALHEKNGKTEERKSFLFLIFKIFWVVLLSELGDKSQIITIILSTHHSPVPVFLGTAIAHVFGVLLSILLGSLVTSRISKKIMNYIAAACFIGYGLFVSVSYFFDKKTII